MNNNSAGNAERIAIILPNKLGDAILSLPLALCLRQLTANFGAPGTIIELITYAPLIEIFGSVGIKNVTLMSPAARIKSWLNPHDKAFFTIATSRNFGYHARSTYGYYQKNKWLAHYKHDLKCIGGEPLPSCLVQYLTEECNLPPYGIRQFGISLELGYSVEQILSTFTFSRQSLLINRTWPANEQLDGEEPYLICCMEAAGGKGRHNDERRWFPEHYLTLARLIHKRYGYRIVFVGIKADPLIPQENGFIDLRGKLDLWRLFQVMHSAFGYFGNDTGPLHLANLAGIPSVGIYPAPNDHAPLFAEHNIAVIKPDCPDAVYQAIQQMIEKRILRQ